ncbi:hypothetical protein BDR05DRAFT_621493 [Suillus weaverae]|nr:hypothetical protein BDR05DRAFT_621493 [Suillus weaverae]
MVGFRRMGMLASVASPADLVLVDQEGHAYSAYLVEAGQTKVFVEGATARSPSGTRGYILEAVEIGVGGMYTVLLSGKAV